MLQAILQVRRELGAVGAKLDRVIADTSEHGRKLDEVQHSLSVVRGGFYALVDVGILALLGWLLRHVGVTIAMRSASGNGQAGLRADPLRRPRHP
jgi:hypothetical protein